MGEKTQDPSQVAATLGVRIPGTASSVRAYAEGFQDWRHLLEFEVPVPVLEEFAKNHDLELNDREEDRPYFDDHWWTLSNREPLSWAYKQTSSPNQHWSLIAFPTEPDHCVVRLQVLDF